jgi:hypothetical protein
LGTFIQGLAKTGENIYDIYASKKKGVRDSAYKGNNSICGIKEREKGALNCYIPNKNTSSCAIIS